MDKNMNVNELLTKQESERIEFLMKILQKLEAQENKVKQELRALIYKIEKI